MVCTGTSHLHDFCCPRGFCTKINVEKLPVPLAGPDPQALPLGIPLRMSFLWALVFQRADRPSWLTQDSASFSSDSLSVGHSTLEPGPWKTHGFSCHDMQKEC